MRSIGGQRMARLIPRSGLGEERTRLETIRPAGTGCVFSSTSYDDYGREENQRDPSGMQKARSGDFQCRLRADGTGWRRQLGARPAPAIHSVGQSTIPIRPGSGHSLQERNCSHHSPSSTSADCRIVFGRPWRAAVRRLCEAYPHAGLGASCAVPSILCFCFVLTAN